MSHVLTTVIMLLLSTFQYIFLCTYELECKLVQDSDRRPVRVNMWPPRVNARSEQPTKPTDETRENICSIAG